MSIFISARVKVHFRSNANWIAAPALTEPYGNPLNNWLNFFAHYHGNIIDTLERYEWQFFHQIAIKNSSADSRRLKWRSNLHPWELMTPPITLRIKVACGFQIVKLQSWISSGNTFFASWRLRSYGISHSIQFPLNFLSDYDTRWIIHSCQHLSSRRCVPDALECESIQWRPLWVATFRASPVSRKMLFQTTYVWAFCVEEFVAFQSEIPPPPSLKRPGLLQEKTLLDGRLQEEK